MLAHHPAPPPSAIALVFVARAISSKVDFRYSFTACIIVGSCARRGPAIIWRNAERTPSGVVTLGFLGISADIDDMNFWSGVAPPAFATAPRTPSLARSMPGDN